MISSVSFPCVITSPRDTHTLSLHDALPIWGRLHPDRPDHRRNLGAADVGHMVGLGCAADSHADHALLLSRLNGALGDRKSTRLNSSHVAISYAVFCLK